MNLGNTLYGIGKILFAVGFTVSILAITGLFGEFSNDWIIIISGIGFAGFVLIGIGRKMTRKDNLNEKLDSDVKKNIDKNPDEEDTKP